jgi:hypothetical protein
MSDDRFRADFAQLVRRLLSEAHDDENALSALLREHLGGDATDLPVHAERLPVFDLANLQLGLDAALARPGFEARIVGLSGQGRHFSDVSLADLLVAGHFGMGRPST